MALEINRKEACDITDLLYEVLEVSDKDWDDVEQAFFDANIYPVDGDNHISLGDNDLVIDKSELKWLNDALVLILKEANLKSLYIQLD